MKLRLVVCETHEHVMHLMKERAARHTRDGSLMIAQRSRLRMVTREGLEKVETRFIAANQPQRLYGLKPDEVEDLAFGANAEARQEINALKRMARHRWSRE